MWRWIPDVEVEPVPLFERGASMPSVSQPMMQVFLAGACHRRRLDSGQSGEERAWGPPGLHGLTTPLRKGGAADAATWGQVTSGAFPGFRGT